uniref:Uncharacterized protein n=1 Tax=Anguilla anguilla TaxID=7936 RepID=A0A0E9WPM8_ANGAN
MERGKLNLNSDCDQEISFAVYTAKKITSSPVAPKKGLLC